MSEQEESEAQASGQGTRKPVFTLQQEIEELKDVILMQEEAYELLSDRIEAASEEEKRGLGFAAMVGSKFCLSCEIVALRAKLTNLKARYESETLADAVGRLRYYAARIEEASRGRV